MKIIGRLLLLVLPVCILSSCATQQRTPNYLQNVSDTSYPEVLKYPELTIQPNDILSIQVYSASTRPEISDAAFNLRAENSDPNTTGFLVDAGGDILYPRIGKIHVEGLTRNQLSDLIRRKINEKDSVLTDPSVIVRFQNFKVIVMGEVNRPGVIQLPGERITILEAIGLAGGVTDFGKKQTVKIIRENNAKREIGVVDLSSDSLFSSQFYHLMQNDMVMVDPTRRKQQRIEQEGFFRQAGFVLSVITATAVVIRLFQ